MFKFLLEQLALNSMVVTSREFMVDASNSFFCNAADSSSYLTYQISSAQLATDNWVTFNVATIKFYPVTFSPKNSQNLFFS